MGLLNVYKFSNTIVPQLSNRFVVSFYTPTNEKYDEEITTFNVKSVDMPIYNIDADENRVRFGNTQFVIPLLDFSKTTLKIKFFETDTLTVTKFLTQIIDNDYFSLDSLKRIKIKIDELSYDMTQVISSHLYIVNLLKFSQPEYSYASRTDVMEITAEFWVEYELQTLLDSIDHKARTKIKTDKLHEKIEPAKETIDIDLGSTLTSIGTSIKESITNKNPAQNPAKALTVDEKVAALYRKVQNANLGRKGAKNDSEAQWIKRFNEDIKRGKIQNAELALEQLENTINRVEETNKKLKEQGSRYRLGFAGIADTYGAIMGGHGESSNHNSVNGGSKADIIAYDVIGNAIDLTNINNASAIMNDIKQTNLWGTGVIEKGNNCWIDLDTKGRYNQDVNKAKIGDNQGDWAVKGVNGNMIASNKDTTFYYHDIINPANGNTFK